MLEWSIDRTRTEGFYVCEREVPGASAADVNRAMSALVNAGALPGDDHHVMRLVHNTDGDVLKTLEALARVSFAECFSYMRECSTWQATADGLVAVRPCLSLVRPAPALLPRECVAIKDRTPWELIVHLSLDGWQHRLLPVRGDPTRNRALTLAKTPYTAALEDRPGGPKI